MTFNIRDLFRSSKRNVAIFIDGPNMIRKEFNIDLKEVRERAQKYGRIVFGKVFLNQFASEKLIEAVVSQGFEPLVTLAVEKDQDIDVHMAAEAMEAAYSSNIDVIVIVSRDTDFLPVVQKAKKKGKITIVMGSEPGFSMALRNAADHVEDLTKK
ncbi:MAG: TIGR00288 family NYN domain-containing protein [Candidatus Aenigmarchaeota archaeon]|nr:TIGR00288 family NYN domain-containing protein [Candidatus Aenigmarchaeota archaeon]